MYDRRYKKDGNYKKLTKQGIKQVTNKKRIVLIASSKTRNKKENEKKLDLDINFKGRGYYFPDYLIHQPLWWYDKKNNILKLFCGHNRFAYYKITNYK